MVVLAIGRRGRPLQCATQTGTSVRRHCISWRLGHRATLRAEFDGGLLLLMLMSRSMLMRCSRKKVEAARQSQAISVSGACRELFRRSHAGPAPGPAP